MGITSDLYEGSANLGRVSSYYTAIICSILGLIFVVVGIWMLFKKAKYTDQVQATINNVHCPPQHDQIAFAKCILEVSYTVDNKKYNNISIDTDDTSYKSNNKVTVYYDPNSPDDISLTKETSSDNRVGAWVFMLLGLLVAGMGWAGVYLTRKSKAVAAVEGVGTVGSFVESLVNN